MERANNLTHLKSMGYRHTTPGSLAILLLAGLLFGPAVWDKLRGQPWINNELSVLQTSNENIIIEDSVMARAPVYGERFLTLEDSKGTVMCSARWEGAWGSNVKKNWSFNSLFGSCAPPLDYSFRICSSFNLQTASGIRKSFTPFCSAETVIVKAQPSLQIESETQE